MPFAPVQTKTAMSTVSGTAIACTFDTPPTEGNFLLAVVMHTGATVLPDSSYGPYGVATGNICLLYHFYKMAGVGEPSAFTVTSPASVTWAVCLREYTTGGEIGNDAVASDSNKVAGASSYTLAITPGPQLETDDLGICSFASQGGTARTFTSWSDGFTEVADLQPAGTVVAYLGVADQIYTASPTPTCTVTLSGVTSTKPSMIVQALYSYMDISRMRFQQQAAAGRW